MKKDKKSNYVWITLRRIFLLTLFVVGFFIPADLAAASGDNVFGPKDFEIGWFRVHISFQRFRMDDPQEGIITIVKSTPAKQIRGGFILLNGKFIGLRHFLNSEELTLEKEVKLRSRNRLLVFLHGAKTASIQVAVKKKAATPAPEVSFSAEPQFIKLGEASSLNWTTSYATSVSIEPDIGSVDPSDSQTVTPTATTTYTLTAEGEGGTTSKSVIVTVHQPPTVTISADPETVTYGASSTLHWGSTHADHVVMDQNIGEVSYDGSLEVRPDSTTTYTITASGPGGSAEAQVVVTVKADVEPQPDGSFGQQYEDLVPVDATIEAYDPRRFSVVTGLVDDLDGLPIADVSVSIHDHPEYSTCFTDGEGRFSIPVEGGGTITLVYQKEGLITAHRKVYVPWNDIAVAETIKMIAADPAATTLTFDGNPDTVITHESTEVTDEFGTRSCSMVFTGDNLAYEVDDQGTVIRELGEITTRATEFTTPEAMPAVLPPNSGYTYCTELSVDGIQRVKFDKPVITWVDNFLGFAVGEIVPVGYYDRDRGLWVPSDNGVVVRLLDTDSDGLVDALDADGDDQADDLNGDDSFSDEVIGLDDALRYPPGSTFWRVAVTHFTPWDYNWPFGPPPGAIAANPEGIGSADQEELEYKACPTVTGSFVEDRSRIFHEDIPIPGTEMTLHYASDRVPGYQYKITVPASGETVPVSLKRIVVRVEVAGQSLEQILDPLPDQLAEFIWDGLDQMGRRVSGPATASISVGFVYNGVYYSARAEFEQAFAQAGSIATGIRTRREVGLWRKYEIVIQRSAGRDIIAEGWTLSVHHHFNPADPSTLHKGDGGILKNNVGIIDTIAGNGTQGFSGDDGKADEAQLYFPRGVAVDAAGNLYVADRGNHRVRKVDTNGIITTVAGNGQYGYTGDGGPATEAKLNSPNGVAVDVSGNLYIADGWNHCIRKVDTSGIITTVAGNGQNGYSGDGGPATQAQLYLPNNVTVDTSGNIYIADTQNQCVRKVDANGIITTVAGGPDNYYLGDGGPAIEASLGGPGDVAVDSSGNLYIAGFDNHRVRKVDTSGIISTIAGSGVPGYSGDGGPATQAQLVHPIGVAVDAASNIYIADLDNYRVRKVDTNRIITTVAGTEVPGYSGDGGPATEAQLNKPWSVAICASGNLYIPDRSNQRIRKVGVPSALAGAASGGDVIFAEEQGLGHILASSGRHKQTIDLDTGVVLYEFGYDEQNRLVTMTDQFGNQSIINRDSNGVPTSIASPDGITTTLTVDGNNHLTRITYPDSSYYSFEYAPDGLLTAKIEPEGNRFEHVFDSIGRLTDANDQEGGHWHYSRIAYANGQIFTQLTTGEGNLTSYLDNTDSTGAYTSTITDPTGAQTLFARSADGLAVNKSLPCGMDLEFNHGLDSEYKFEYVKEMTESTPAGLEKMTSRDKTYEDTDADDVPDLITETVTVNGKETTLATDTVQATKTITSPLGRKVSTAYDPNTLLTTGLSIPALHDTTYGYDVKGRLTSIATSTRQTTFTYNAQGFLESITDPESQTTTYSYDAVGRMAGISRPDTSSVGFSYDANGNMTVLSNPASISHGFGYNKVNLNSSYTTPLSGSYSYLYDKDRRLTQVNFPSGKQINNVYANGRLEQIQTPEGNVDLTYFCSTKVDSITKGTEEISYGYDGSLVTAEVLSGNLNQSLTYGYNNDFNLTSFTYGGGTVNYSYDNDGLLTGVGAFTVSRNSGNGLPEAVTGGALNLGRTFNGYGEVEAQDFTVGSQGVTSWSLTRDNGGRIISKSETVAGVTSSYAYTYDSMGRLLTVTRDGNPVEEYQYDSVGTRTYEKNTLRGITTARTFTYDDEDHLLTVGDATYQYDLDGYLTTRTVGTEAPYEVTSYVYSSRGELLRVTLPDTRVIEYVHDPLGRRIAKKVDGVIIEKYLWQGLTRLLAVYDASDSLVMRLLYADGRMPVAMKRAGTTYYFTYDQVGSLRVVADGSGSVVKRIDYDSFGNIVYDSAPSFEIPFGFAGGLQDRDTGLIRFGFRDYDPDTARWTAKDPILFAGGNVDLYGYCLNDPINLIDPSGLVKWGTVFKGSVAAVAGGLSVYGGALLSMTGAGAVVGVPAVVGGAVSIGWGVSQIIIGFTDNELNLPKPSVASLTTLVVTGGDVDRACQVDLIVDTLSLGGRVGTMAGRVANNLELVVAGADFVDVSTQAISLGPRREK